MDKVLQRAEEGLKKPFPGILAFERTLFKICCEQETTDKKL
ncbi:MAG TPA: hypothetical protein PLC35_08890 [Methanosarcina vacuolata]|nr:hypothetical protein [Methanosarcina vacuolata]